MGPPSCLTDPTTSVVLDTSAAINLIATGCGAEILRALPQRILVVDAIPAELNEGRRRGRRDADIMDELIAAQLVKVVTLGNRATEIFEGLVIGSAAQTLDDGEAATLAFAVESEATAIIDERKATRISNERFPVLPLACTVDLIAHPAVMTAIGRDNLAQAVFNALQIARMRVQPHHIDWVVSLIGMDKIHMCTSLPGSIRSDR